MMASGSIPALLVDAYTFHACVDWIELEIRTAAATNPQTIRDHFPPSLHFGEGEIPRVEPIGGLPNGTASTFRFKVQQPPSAAAVEAGLRDLAGRFPLLEVPTVTAVEVACDLRSIQRDADELVDAAHYLQWGHRLACFRQPGGKPPLWRVVERGTGPVNAADPRFTRSFVRDALAHRPASLLTGDRDERPVLLRVYVKEADNAGRTTYPASARFEARLTDEALPFRTVAEWAAFRFELLAPGYFSWLTCPPDRRHEVASDERAQLMVRAGDPVLPGQPMLDGWRPHEALNRRVRRALQRLTVQQARGWVGSKVVPCGPPIATP